jgi:hypothetical protein
MWQEVIVAACYLLNRLPSRRQDVKAPLEVKHGRKPYVGDLRVYGYKACVLRYDIAHGENFMDSTIAGRLYWLRGRQHLRCLDFRAA